MGRKMTMGLFLFVLVVSLFFYMLWEEKPLYENLTSQDPRVVLLNFILTKFDGEKVFTQFKGAKAALLTPHLVEMPSYVTGWRLRDGKKEAIAANQAKAELDAAHISDLSGRVKVRQAFFGDGVTISSNDLVLETQEAHYLGDNSQMIVGDKFVKVYGPGHWISGDKGFEFDLNEEDLELLGKIQGVATPDAK